MPEEGEFIGGGGEFENYSGPSSFFNEPRYIKILKKILKGDIKLKHGEYIQLPPEELILGQIYYFLLDIGNYLDPSKAVIKRLTIPTILDEINRHVGGEPSLALPSAIINDLFAFSEGLVPYMIDLARIQREEDDKNSIYLLKTQNSLFIIQAKTTTIEFDLLEMITRLSKAVDEWTGVVGRIFAIDVDTGGFTYVGVYSNPEVLLVPDFYRLAERKTIKLPFSSARIPVVLNENKQSKYEIEVYYKNFNISGISTIFVMVPKDILNKYIEAYIRSNNTMHIISEQD